MSCRLDWFVVAAGLVAATPALAGVTIAPYASIKSDKGIKPAANGQEQSDLKERQEYGLRGAVKLGSFFSFQLSVGQSKLTTTESTQTAADEYREIDYKSDLNMATSSPGEQIKITETQRNARAGVTIDPSFGILVLRAQAGVQATQRFVDSQVTGQPAQSKVFGPFYKPYSGFGAGVRLTPGTYFMAEYNMLHYAFPKIQPFEREVAVTYAVSL